MPYLKLEDFLAPSPLPAIIAVLMTLGLKYLGGRIIRLVQAERSHPIQAAAGFIVATSLVAMISNFLAMAGLVNLWLLRGMAWSLVALGLLELSGSTLEFLSSGGRRLALGFHEQSSWGKTALVLLGITLLGLWLSTLAPPTDADSLNYHLGVPLDILRHGGAYPRPDWLHARLVGLGESLNMLGLAGGTDIWGASLQFAGLVAALAAITEISKTDGDRILLALGLVGCPVVVFLVPNQKPQMLPIAATTIAIILVAQRSRAIDLTTLILAFCCAFFAMSCKSSFLLSGALIIGVGLFVAYRARVLSLGLGVALASYLVLVFPVHLKNYFFYGDPLTLFLERFRPAGDPIVIRFAADLRRFYDSGVGSIPFPLSLIFPFSMEVITATLGLGAFLFLVALRGIKTSGPTRILLTTAFLAIISVLLLGQVTARFFLEPYLWILTVAGTVSWSPLKKFLSRALVCQLLIIAPVIWYGTMILFPGALTQSLRDKVMTKAAYGYPETRWLDQSLSKDAVVVGDIRSMALMPRPCSSGDLLNLADGDDPRERHEVISTLKSSQVNTLVACLPLDPQWLKICGPYLGKIHAGPMEFKIAVRNPWNRETRQLAVYPLNFEKAELGRIR